MLILTRLYIMQNRKIELTAIGNKERLSHLVERAKNIFKVVAQNYDNEVITIVDDIYLAIKHPLKVTGWSHDWQADERNQLEKPYEKCMETMQIANDAKKSVAYLLKSLSDLHEEIYKLTISGEKTEEFIDKFGQYALDCKIKISYLDTKNTFSSNEQTWLDELKSNLALLEDSKDALEVVRPGIEKQRVELSASIENLAELFLTDEIPLEKINLEQEIKVITDLIDNLYAEVKNTYIKQSQLISDLGKLFYAMSERCHEILVVVESIIKTSKDLCNKSDRLINFKAD